MNWIFLLIGVAIGIITGYFVMVLYISTGIYGTMHTDRSDKDHYIFRMEFTQDPAEFPSYRKYMIFKINETHLEHIKDEE